MASESQHTVTGRLVSLDAFRGFTIAAMIMVNYPGRWSHVFAPLLHENWHGITPTDLIYPFFIFIVGVSIVLAYNKRLAAGLPKKDMYKKIVSRSIKIFAVGIFLALFPMFDFANLRFAGVLQRIALVFAACAFLYLNAGWKKQAWTGAVILITYWLAMTLIPTPEAGKPMLEPGVNLAAWIDQQLLPGRMWQGDWDPEGILSTLPINKNIWTSSYVLYTSGLAAMTLAAAMFLIDILGYRRGTGFGIIYGANAITAYVLAGVLSGLFYGIQYWGGKSLNHHFVDSLWQAGLDPRIASLMYALMYVFVIFIPVYYLYRKKIFIKL